MMGCRSGKLIVDFTQSTQFTTLLGFGSDQGGSDGSFTTLSAPQIDFGTAKNPARIDKTRAVSFHCPSLASGTYSTTGQMGGSQLAMVPITVGVGEVQSWETSVPIKLPASVAGSVRHKIHLATPQAEAAGDASAAQQPCMDGPRGCVSWLCVRARVLYWYMNVHCTAASGLRGMCIGTCLSCTVPDDFVRSESQSGAWFLSLQSIRSTRVLTRIDESIRNRLSISAAKLLGGISRSRFSEP
jgi:hypothetical protein